MDWLTFEDRPSLTFLHRDCGGAAAASATLPDTWTTPPGKCTYCDRVMDAIDDRLCSNTECVMTSHKECAAKSGGACRHCHEAFGVVGGMPSRELPRHTKICRAVDPSLRARLQQMQWDDWEINRECEEQEREKHLRERDERKRKRAWGL